MATIKEVAERARVSVGTVSNVLAGKVPVSKHLRDRVLEAVRRLDYHPNFVARSLKMRQTQVVGMIVSDLACGSIPELVRGAEEAAWRANYLTIVFSSDDEPAREREALGALRSRCVDGVLLMAAPGSDRAYLRSVQESEVPIVCIDREIPGLDCVLADDFGGMRECIAHLRSLGHSRIGLLNASLQISSARERYLGYRQALEEAGLPYDPSLVETTGTDDDASYSRALELLSRNPRPTATIAAHPALLAGVVRAMKSKTLKCPEDVALVAFDDSAFAEALQVTAVSQPSFDMGQRAMELLLTRMADPQRRRVSVVLEPKLALRESTAALKPVSVIA